APRYLQTPAVGMPRFTASTGRLSGFRLPGHDEVTVLWSSARATLRAMKDIRALTSFRGVAALWVLLFHLELEGRVFPAALKEGLAVGRGYIAVDLFFVLSGFVMALTYTDSFRTRPFAAAYPDFLLRRVARVMPLNFAIVAVLVAIVWLSPLPAR